MILDSHQSILSAGPFSRSQLIFSCITVTLEIFVRYLAHIVLAPHRIVFPVPDEVNYGIPRSVDPRLHEFSDMWINWHCSNVFSRSVQELEKVSGDNVCVGESGEIGVDAWQQSVFADHGPQHRDHGGAPPIPDPRGMEHLIRVFFSLDPIRGGHQGAVSGLGRRHVFFYDIGPNSQIILLPHKRLFPDGLKAVILEESCQALVQPKVVPPKMYNKVK